MLNLFSPLHTQKMYTSCHRTFFTSKCSALPPMYLYQKDERVQHGTLKSHKIFFLAIEEVYPTIHPLPLPSFYTSSLLRLQGVNIATLSFTGVTLTLSEVDNEISINVWRNWHAKLCRLLKYIVMYSGKYLPTFQTRIETKYWGSRFLWNVCKFPPDYTASRPRRRCYSHLPIWNLSPQCHTVFRCIAPTTVLQRNKINQL